HNFEKTGLRKQSVLKLNRIVTLNKRIIIGRIGTLSEEYLKQVNIKLKNMLRL
ncbi:type II toxin-antitoxin system PemK/MazF family toxin, partial [Candidatus Woesearchaeota archaeon]|nr:type II toxin-antitoxin system PemK/MazF family toxin [Candidatus Woesearchaeota archaeon]